MSHMTVLGFDYGKARIGVHITNTLTGIATPQSTIQAHAGLERDYPLPARMAAQAPRGWNAAQTGWP